MRWRAWQEWNRKEMCQGLSGMEMQQGQARMEKRQRQVWVEMSRGQTQEKRRR